MNKRASKIIIAMSTNINEENRINTNSIGCGTLNTNHSIQKVYHEVNKLSILINKYITILYKYII